MFKFHKTYFVLTILLFITEVLIALFVYDDFIRPYVGDFLVVMLLYCLAKSFLKLPVIPTAIGVLLFSYLIETLQYFNIVQHLDLGNSKIAKTVIGNYFTWVDILAYTLGILAVIGIEKFRLINSNRKLHQVKDTNTWLFL